MPPSPALLYSFRRCPYAMRARMALILCKKSVAVQEISLKAKPAGLLAANPKGTVPVLIKPNGEVLCESLDIMLMAIAESQDQDMKNQLNHRMEAALELIHQHDTGFKPWLDKYKYFDRHPEHPQHFYRQHYCQFLNRLEQQLGHRNWLLGDKPSLADIALFPFVRQFAAVDSHWFENAPLPELKRWLGCWLRHPAFTACMHKYPEGGEPQLLRQIG
ncbi:glutathione S-transferase [Shewanella sp.]|uniref:glutathione S-transferase n=1 Tax=Shewanella sp. TaxID=50422 RepID=UPI003565AD26